ncbi:MAG: class I SAM-dependent methyltransferase [Vicinamibacteraceae bacterium]
MDDPTRLTRGTYDVVAPRYLEKARDRGALRPHLDAFVAALTPGSRVVDLGAGPGFDTALLVGRGLRAIGIDFSLGMLRAGVGESPGARLQGDARRLPVATGSMEGVWANASLLHLGREDALRALADVRRILRPGGILFVSVKAGDGAATETARYGLPRFFQYWSDADLDAALEGHAFQILTRSTDQGEREPWLTRLTRRR